MQNKRERLGSRLGFILLSAGCAIGCGNVWKFPWMCGQNGGGAFVVVYLICLLILGLPVMTMEFAMGRGSQASPIAMYDVLEPKKSKWHIHGYFAFAGNCFLMMFYTCVAGWMIYYMKEFACGNAANIGFVSMISSPSINLTYTAIVVAVGFFVLAFNLQGGLEKVTKIMMVALFALIIGLAVRSVTLEGAEEGLSFYLKPDLSKINGQVVVAAMNQAFFTLSLGIGSMAIFGSYIDKKRSLMGESVNVIILDTLVALLAGLIIFPACSAYDLEVGAGPSLLFETMRTAFINMEGGRFWGFLFFLFMVFAAMSTVLAVFENILAMVREKTGWGRVKGAIICGIIMFILAIPCALGYSTLSGFVPFASGSAFLDLWDFCVSYVLLPTGAIIFALFCTWKFGWGWENFKKEANSGEGLKVKDWMKPIFGIVVPIAVGVVLVYGLVTFQYKDAPAAEEPAQVEEAAETEVVEETAETEAAAETETVEETAETEAAAETEAVEETAETETVAEAEASEEAAETEAAAEVEAEPAA